MRIIQLRAPESLLVTIANRGPAGRDGIDGKSIVGPKGDPGQSITGPAGKDGQSITGPRGLQGVPGRDGVSIQGVPGIQGIPGPAGASIVGPIGPMGPAGASITGATGAAGRDGGTMLPIKPFIGSLVTFGPPLSANMAGFQASADRFDLYPFIPAYNFAIDQLNVTTTAPVAGSNCKICVYDADADGLPFSLQIETADIATVATSSAGQSTTCIFNFIAGKIYWLGVRYSAAQSLRGASALNWPYFARSEGTFYNSFRRTLAYAEPAPALFAPLASEMNGAALPVIGGRRA